VTILQSLARRYAYLTQTGELAEPGLAPIKIGFEIVLEPDGRLKRIALLDRAEPMHVPSVNRTAQIKPATLWDKTAYLLGLINVEVEKDGATVKHPGVGKRTAAEHAAFVAHHTELIGDSKDEGLRAVCLFLESWTPDRFESEGHDAAVVDQNGVFRLDGDTDANGHRRFVHERPAARALWKTIEPQTDRATDGLIMCLVTGMRAPTARLHPTIKGVAGAQSSGASLVSFNERAFTSHGWSQGANAPVSEEAAHAYGTALNALLAKGSGHSTRVGDATVVFWAETVDGEPATAEEKLVAGAIGADEEFPELWTGDEDDVTDIDAGGEDATRLREIVVRLGQGRPVDTRLGGLDPRTAIHVLGLSPNNARLAVRFWHVGSLGELTRNIARHWEDMALALDPRGSRPPAPWQLVSEAGRHVHDESSGRWKALKGAGPPARLSGEMLRAILEGTDYPGSLLTMLLMRVRAERGRVPPRKAALFKAIFNRNIARGRKEEVLGMALDRTREDVAYLLGRLFALYEWSEEAASGGRVASLRDRYFATASATPERVFGTLGISYGHNHAKLRKGEGRNKGLAIMLEKEVTGVIGAMPADVPRAFSGEDQARFIIGYYHQMQDRYTSRNVVETAEETEET